jgi:hypothetical protein
VLVRLCVILRLIERKSWDKREVVYLGKVHFDRNRRFLYMVLGCIVWHDLTVNLWISWISIAKSFTVYARLFSTTIRHLLD